MSTDINDQIIEGEFDSIVENGTLDMSRHGNRTYVVTFKLPDGRLVKKWYVLTTKSLTYVLPELRLIGIFSPECLYKNVVKGAIAKILITPNVLDNGRIFSNVEILSWGCNLVEKTRKENLIFGLSVVGVDSHEFRGELRLHVTTYNTFAQLKAKDWEYDCGMVVSTWAMNPNYLWDFVVSNDLFRRYQGPLCSRYLTFFISENEGKNSLKKVRRLIEYLLDRYGNNAPILIWSDGDIFYVRLALAHLPAPSDNFHNAAKMLAKGIAKNANIVIDLDFYRINSRMRLPNTRNVITGRYLRLFNAQEILNFSDDDIRNRALQQAVENIPSINGEIPQLVTDWEEAENASKN